MTNAEPQREAWARHLYLAGALALLLLGGGVLVGWFAGIRWLVQVHESLPPAPANGGLGLIVFGLALLAQGYRNRLWAALAILPAAAGVLTLVEYALPLSLGFDEWLLPHRRDPSPEPGRLAPALAIGFVLAGLAISSLVFGRSRRFRPLLLAAVGSLVSAAGFAAATGHATGLAAATTLGLARAVPPVMAAGLFVLGVTVVCLGVLDRPRGDGPPRWVPAPLMIGCATVTVIFWIALRQRETGYQAAALELNASNLAFALSAELEGQIKALTRIANRELLGREYTDRMRQSDAVGVTRDFPAISYVAWLDSEARTRRLVPIEGNEPALGLEHATDPRRRLGFVRARDSRGPALAGPITPKLGPLVLALYTPVYVGDTFVTMIAAEVRAGELVAGLVRRLQLGPAYTLAVSVQDVPVLGELPVQPVAQPGEAVDQLYNILGQRVRVLLTRPPKDERALPGLAGVVLTAGLGLSTLLGLVAGLVVQARHRQMLAEASARQLEAENHERRQIEVRLKLSEERLNLALDSSQVGVFDWNVATGRVYFSPGVWVMLGYQPGAMAPSLRSWDSLIQAEDRRDVRRDFSLRGGSSAGFVESEYRVRAHDGEWCWVLERSKCVSFAPDGTPLRVTGTFQDITSRKQAEVALRASQAEARKLAIVASITDNLVIITDATGRIEWVNESFSRLLEYSLGEVVGRSVEELLIGAETPAVQAAQVRQAFSTRLPLTAEIGAVSRQGRHFHLHLEIQPASNEHGAIEKFIAVLYDITARIETENNLRLAKSQAEGATRAKSEFLASMSHEIRTPMNGVIGLARLLLESPLNHEQQDWARTIQSSGDALLTIINDILDFSKIESGRLEIERRPFVVAECVEEALDLFAVPAGTKQIELSYFLAPTVPAAVLGDSTRLRQVLVNLVGNAVKFTRRGRIAVEVEPDAAPDHLRFRVIDTGIGIPADRIGALFLPFSQVDSSMTRRFGGTGLGLAISKRLVELMGGEIGLTSQIDEGTTFVFTIAASAAPAADLPPTPAPGGIGRNAVVIDDDPVSCRFLIQYLENDGYACLAYASRAAALDGLAGVPAPDLMIIDQTLVDADGLETAAALRANFRRADIAIVLLTLSGQAPSPDRLASFGVRTCLHKPVRQVVLRDRIARAQARRPAGEGAAPAVAESRLVIADRIPLKVLLAEDNPVNKKVALRLLERLGYHADAVATGLEAVRAVTEGAYQVVFMDVQMPDMDGLEATRRIRASVPKERQPVIVALTANAIAGDAELCRGAGMDDYVTKPVTPEDIHNAIIRHFGRGSGIEQIRKD